ncbi:MAG TPA: hypothetical protein VF407_22775, partial [Polyangiaceae bacterium]
MSGSKESGGPVGALKSASVLEREKEFDRSFTVMSKIFGSALLVVLVAATSSLTAACSVATDETATEDS